VTGAMTIALSDQQHLRLESKLRRESGESIVSLLANGEVEDILLNPGSSLWVKRRGAGFVCCGTMTPAAATSALGTVAAWRGTVLNRDHPILETELPLDGSRCEGIVAPVVRRPVFAIRLRPRKVFTLDDYEAAGILTEKEDASNRVQQQEDSALAVRRLPRAEIIRAAVRERKNILVVGATGSGKTTLLNAILDAIAELTPFDRVISIEDSTELRRSKLSRSARCRRSHHAAMLAGVHAIEAHYSELI
jgi:type IV secretion system protein TrbB